MLSRIPHHTNFYKTVRDAIEGDLLHCCTLPKGSLVFYNQNTGVCEAILPGGEVTVFAEIPLPSLIPVEELKWSDRP